MLTKQPPTTFMETVEQTFDPIPVLSSDIKKMLHWYKDEFFLIKEAIYNNSELRAKIKFSHYPFIRGKMPFVSSNLINLAADQCDLVHMGLMVKYKFIELEITKSEGLDDLMTFEEYNLIVGDEFVTAKKEGNYHNTILPEQEVWIKSNLLELSRSSKGRYKFSFRMCCENFFTIESLLVYPLNLYLLGK